MAELKVDERQIAQPSAPDLGNAGQAYGVLGKAVQGISSGIGDIVKANHTLEEKSLLAGASTEIERLKLKYAADPMLTLDKVKEFQAEADAISQGWLDTANPVYSKTLTADLKQATDKSTTSLIGDAYKRSLAIEKRDISLAFNETQAQYVQNIESGDIQSAAKNREDMAAMLKAYADKGAPAKEIIAMSETTDSLGIAANYNAKLKNARDQTARNSIMKDMLKLPDTPANAQAITLSWKEYSRLSKLYKKGSDLSKPYMNIVNGTPWNNRDLNKSDSNDLVDKVANNIASRSEEAPTEPVNTPTYQALPAYPGQNKTYDYEEELAAEREGRPQNLYLADAYVDTAEAEPAREPSLFELAQAHAMVGSKNSTRFPSEVSNRLHAGPGEEVKNAVIALNHVLKEAPSTIDLDSKSDIIYTEFKIGMDSGRTDYDNLAAESRATVKDIKQADLKVYLDTFNTRYSMEGKGLENLNKLFKEFTGVNAIETDSLPALRDFHNIFRAKFLASGGKWLTAYDSAKREMVKVHGADKFSATRADLSVGISQPLTTLFVENPIGDFQYVRFPPSVVLPGLTPRQINNQLTEQLVFAAESNPNIKVPPHYVERVQKATETQKMESTLAFPAPDWSRESFDTDPANYITVHVPGVGDVEGRVFLKSNALTAQNNSGMPVWEVWIQDRVGQEYAVPDDKSPHNNIMLFAGQTASQFAPEYIKSKDSKDFEENVNKQLAEEGRKLYSVFAWNPQTIARNYELRKAYSAEMKNIERVKEKVKKTTGKGGSND